MAEQLGTEVTAQQNLQFETVNPQLAAFSSAEVTKFDETKPWKPPLEVTVSMPDGSKIDGVDAAEPVFAFKAPTGDALSVSIADAAHIKSLHIDGTEAGSKFDYDTLDALFTDIAPKIPPDVAATQSEVSAFAIDTGKKMGKEGVASMSELVADGALSESDVQAASQLQEGVSILNLEGDADTKAAFVESYKQDHPDAKIKFALVRGSVIVPTVDTPKRDTTELFMVFGPGPKGKTLYTAAPGRFMPKHPDPSQHMDETGKVNIDTFRESADAWFETVMLTGK